MPSNDKSDLSGIDYSCLCSGNVALSIPLFVLIVCLKWVFCLLIIIIFYPSLAEISDEAVIAIAVVLKTNQSLKTLK